MENEENEAEPHSMWEYPCRALSDVFNVLNFNFLNPIPNEKQEINDAVKFTRYYHGFLFQCILRTLWLKFLVKRSP